TTAAGPILRVVSPPTAPSESRSRRAAAWRTVPAGSTGTPGRETGAVDRPRGSAPATGKPRGVEADKSAVPNPADLTGWSGLAIGCIHFPPPGPSIGICLKRRLPGV